MNEVIVFDIECDGFNPTKIHVLSANKGGKVQSTRNYGNMRKLLTKEDNVLVGHNIIRFDIPVLERLLDIKIKAKLVDTLALSWYLYPERSRHGLEFWGEDFGVPKPKVTDWEGLSYEEYRHRCQEDVTINTKLWEKQWLHLKRLYGSEEEAWRLIDYLSFKMGCAREQEERRWKLDVPKAQALKQTLSERLSEAQRELSSAMPNVPITKLKRRPVKPYKKDGSLSAVGERWEALCAEYNVPFETEEIVVTEGYNGPNAQSDPQIKAWLFSLGWEPCTFKFKRDKETGDVREIPQVRRKNEENEAELTPSVQLLIERCPEVSALRDVGVIKHRLDVVSGFVTSVDSDGYIRARIGGLTNTLRFKHREVVNLPGVDKPYGADLRGCLICEDDEILIGSDVSSLEDTTKRHYMYDYDPEYVKEMSSEDYDPHLSLALFAGAITARQLERHNSGEEKQSAIRKVYKCVNYASVYGAGGATVARAAGVSKREGDKLVKAYWAKNWAVEAVAKAQKVKTVSGQKWLQNPVSGLWYSLRHEKDRFSTLNQGTGVWVFDNWLMNIRKRGLPIVGQMHDEFIGRIKKGKEERARRVALLAMQEVNEQLRLNQEVRVDIQFGESYAEIH